MNDLQILKGSQQDKETESQSFIPYWNFSMIDDEEARENFMKDICTFLTKFSRIPFGVMPKVLSIAWERFGEIKDALTDEQYQQEDIQKLMSKLFKDVRNIREELSEYINCLSWNRPTFYDNDDDKYTIIYSKPKAITPDLPIEEPGNSLIMGDEHLDTIPSVENLSIPNDGTSCDDDDFEDIEYVSLEEVNDVDQEEKEFDLEDILQIQDVILREKLLKTVVFIYISESLNDNPIPLNTCLQDSSVFSILREKLLNVNLLVDKIEALKLTPSIPFVLEYPSSSPIPVMDSDFLIEEVDTFLILEDSIPPDIESDFDLEGDIIPDELLNNDPILEYERFTFDIEPDEPMINDFDELNEDECFDPGGGEIDVSQNIEDDDSFAFVIRTFLPYLTYPVDSPLLLSTGSEDTIFDPGIST
ncbi:hypothetical protein Tco_1004998 [Tanacetum coccineum]|uniref:Uncharacterized protein n=1 Tax=Tanacetum coccineum TaxID=301880 RepID=A0ABQ5FDN3_9ASTR